jgi:UDP-glucose:(heptosyl)LPS alpha-1,3-glucosyltransferase
MLRDADAANASDPTGSQHADPCIVADARPLPTVTVWPPPVSFVAADLTSRDWHILIGAINESPAPINGSNGPPSLKPLVALVAHDVHDGGGMERVCAELIRRGSTSVDFVVISATLAPELRGLVKEWKPVRVPARPFPLKFAAFWFRAAARLDEVRADIVHTVGAIIPRPVDVAAVHFCHAGYVRSQRRLAPPQTALPRRINTSISRLVAIAAERRCFRPARLRAFAAVSDGVRRELESNYPGIPVFITPNGVDRERFAPDAAARAVVRDELSVGSEAVAAFVGGDWQRKGLDLAIEAVATSAREGTPIRLWVVGEGDAERYRESASRQGAGELVSFLGRREDVERILAGADMFVFPSSYEAHPLVALEAAASGLPIVATPVHGVRDLLADDGAGVLVERSATSIAAGLRLLGEDETLRAKLGGEALARSVGYSWQDSIGGVLDVYSTLLQGDGR